MELCEVSRRVETIVGEDFWYGERATAIWDPDTSLRPDYGDG